MKLNCILADDEPLAREILEKYIQDHPNLELAASCRDAFETQLALTSKPCDLLFLDIQMPQLTGINLFRSLNNPPVVIFTTAYAEYAVEGYELNAADYLLKPFSFERFMKAVNKAIALMKSTSVQDNKHEAADYLFFRVDKKLKKVGVSEIRYLESIGDYAKLYTTSEVMIISETLKSLQEQLPDQIFFRIHKSYIISLNHIGFVEGNYVRLNNTDLPIGASYREEFLEKLQEKNRKKSR